MVPYTVNVASYVDISTPVFTTDTKNLTATLNNPGTDPITESGFVWGVMNAPSLTVNNGKATTSPAVSKVNDKISVTASNLQKGVTYYARAYITAGGVTYYSEEIKIGIDLPDYGTFTIKNNGNNTFTVTRSGKGEGAQTVYYRTVNGSAVGGTHFTHKAGTLSFPAGTTSLTFSVDETTANTAYKSNTATAYTNADRTYSVEIYRVTGGGSLGSTTSAARTMTMNSDYAVNRTIYTTEVSGSYNIGGGGSYDNKWVADRSGKGDGKLYWRNNRGKNEGNNCDNYHNDTNIDKRYNKLDYIKNTASSYLYRYKMTAYEDEDAWEHAWLGTHAPGNAGTADKCSGSYTDSAISLTDSEAGTALWTAVFEMAEKNNVTKYFPTSTINTGRDNGSNGLSGTVYACNGAANLVNSGSYQYAKIPIDKPVYNYFAATGGNEDRWYFNTFTDYTLIYDTVEPTFLAVAPMAGGLYKPGDTYTVSLIFDEIVDSTNSSLSSVKVKTTWGEAAYAGGENTNVLYFTGKVSSAVNDTTLKVNEIVNPGNIKDMCNCTTTTATKTGSGDTSATVDTSAPKFTVTAKSISNGTGTAAITVNDDKSKTTGMSYAWSDSATAPTTGWVELSSGELSTAKSSSGLSLSIRKEPGSGSSNGKWYLHVKGIYDTTGATAYSYAVLDFGTKANPAMGSTAPALTVTVDNTNWATQRTITVKAVGAAELKYRKSGTTAWTTLNTTATSVTVTENGYYTFLLTAGDITVTKTVQVEKIDTDNPTASVGEPTSGSVNSPKEGVYTALTLPITYADAQSGVNTVQYKWTDNAATPTSSWLTLSTSAAAVTYSANESTPTKKYLHIKVTDKVGNTCTACSDAYTVISQTAIDNHAPKISITGAPTAWTNDMATLTWKLTNNSGKNYEVTLPNGRTSANASGEVWAMQNDAYTVTVRDLDYGGENTASITVDKLDFTAPSVTVSGVSENWKNSAQTVLCYNRCETKSIEKVAEIC